VAGRAAGAPDSAAASAPAVGRAAGNGFTRGAPAPGAEPAPPGTAADSADRAAELRRSVSAANDTSRYRPRRGRFDTPRWVMLRSLGFPGWGQLHNGSWLKAVLIGGLDTYLRFKAVDNELWIRRHEGPVRNALLDLTVAQDSLRQYTVIASPDTTIYQKLDYWNPIYLAASDRYNGLVGPYNDRLDRQIGEAWLLGGVLVYALMDAYVDAHFRDFKVEFQHDPALPGGRPGGTRLFLRWTF
jgi:hypothetical protein